MMMETYGVLFFNGSRIMKCKRILKGDVVLVHIEDYDFVYGGLITCGTDEDDIYSDTTIVFAEPQGWCFGVKDLHCVSADNILLGECSKKIERRLEKRGYAWVLKAKLISPKRKK
jgi:hypothetical protein